MMLVMVLVRMLLEKVEKPLIVLGRKYMPAAMVAVAAVVLRAKVAAVARPVAETAEMVPQELLLLHTPAMARAV